MSEFDQVVLSSVEKALKMNLDASKYGTFAEIGAGQEVSNWFFRAGAANGTVAKTISAYGMVMSDALYGSGVRYVSRERLQAMLDHEFGILCERLDEQRGQLRLRCVERRGLGEQQRRQRGRAQAARHLRCLGGPRY